MKLMIVGNDPSEIGGVANYTRPLALKFKELGHEVFYLYSGAFHSRYDLYMRPYLKIRHDLFPFECAEIVNSTNLPFNFGHPNWTCFRRDEPAHQGIYRTHQARCDARPLSIWPTDFRQRTGIRVRCGGYQHVHVYGYICQRRVMIDRDGELCPGPFDLRNVRTAREPSTIAGAASGTLYQFQGIP